MFLSVGTGTGTGSCRNKCGKSSSGCHCDNACKGYKDCCSDYNQYCKSSDKYSYRVNTNQSQTKKEEIFVIVIGIMFL